MPVTTLNQYDGTWALNAKASCVAADMETAARTLKAQNASQEDPIILQCVKQDIQVELPAIAVAFESSVMPDTAASAGCVATPERYVLPAGTEQVFTAKGAVGWDFDHWEIDGAASGTDAVALLAIPSSPTTVKFVAHFTPVSP